MRLSIFSDAYLPFLYILWQSVYSSLLSIKKNELFVLFLIVEVPYIVCKTYSFLKKILFIFRDRGKEGEREGEKHQLVASCMPRTGDLAGNPGMCPDWESNQ